MKKIILATFLVVITVCVFRPAERFGFVNWDDDFYVYQNPFIRSIDAENVAAWFKKPFVSLYTPVSMMTYAVDYRLSGGDASGYHRTNIVLHALNVVLVFVVLSLFFKDDWLCFLGAALFAVHPAQVQTVAWISERKTLLFSFFSLLSVVAYVKTPVLRVALPFLFLGALFSKITAAMLPPVLMLCGFFISNKKQKIFGLWPLFLTAILAGVLTLSLYFKHLHVYQKSWLRDIFLNSILRLGIYLKNVVFPDALGLLYPLDEFLKDKLAVTRLIALGLIFMGLTLFGFLKKKRFLFWALWVWAWFLPVLIFFAVPVSDHHGYMPLVGLIGLALCLNKLSRPAVFVSMAALILLCLPMTVRQLGQWQNGETLWKSVLTRYPAHYAAGIGQADYYRDQGRITEAVACYKKLIHDWPATATAYLNLGNLYLMTGQASEALTIGNLLKKNIPNDPQVWSIPGTAAFLKGDHGEAIGYFEKVLASDPFHARALILTGLAYRGKGDFERALFFLKKSAVERHEAEGYYYWALVANELGRWEEAVESIQAMRSKMIYYPGACFQEGYAWLKMGKRKEAKTAYLRSTALDPGLMEAFYHLGLMEYQDKNLPEALALLKKAQVLKPEYGRIRPMILEIEHELNRIPIV